MILLIILFFVYGFLTLFDSKFHILKETRGSWAMGVMLMFTGSMHFFLVNKMCLMIPDFIPHRPEIIYLSGILEIMLGISLMIPQWRRLAGALIIIFFILIFPSNIYAAWQKVDFGGHKYGLVYLLFRGPLQLFLIYWTYYFTHGASKKISKLG